MVPTRSGTFHGHDGTRLYFEEHGEGPPVVLANGIVCTIEPYWQFQIPALARNARVIAWDYRGHGRSSLPADLEASGVEDHARDLLCLLDHLGLERAVLVGHSMGVQVILETFLRAPTRVAALIPIAGTYGRPYRTFYDTDVMEWFYDPMLRWARDHHEPLELVARLIARTPLPQLLARTGAVHWYLAPWDAMHRYFEHFFSLDMQFALTAMRKLGAHSAEEALERIDLPTLIIAGARDPMTPLHVSEEMHRRIAGSELLAIRTGTHVPQIEHPELVNLRIEKFLEDHGLVAVRRAARPKRRAAAKKRAPAVRAKAPARPRKRAARAPASPSAAK